MPMRTSVCVSAHVCDFQNFFVVLNLLLTCAIIFIALPNLPHRPYALCLFCLTSSVFVATIVITSIFPPSKYIHISERVDNIWKYHHQQKRHQQHQNSRLYKAMSVLIIFLTSSHLKIDHSQFSSFFFVFWKVFFFFVYIQWLDIVSCWIFGVIWICSTYSNEDMWWHFFGVKIFHVKNNIMRPAISSVGPIYLHLPPWLYQLSIININLLYNQYLILVCN